MEGGEDLICFPPVLQNAFKLLAWILLPCIIVELIHKGWWYLYVSVELPFLAKDPILNVFLCIGSIVAWLYKSMVFLFVCVLFRLMCSLQIFRLQGYIKLLEETTDVGVILQEHMRIRDQLSTISHRFRVFVVLSMLTITLSQLYSLFVISDAQNNINFFRAGDLVVRGLHFSLLRNIKIVIFSSFFPVCSDINYMTSPGSLEATNCQSVLVKFLYACLQKSVPLVLV